MSHGTADPTPSRVSSTGEPSGVVEPDIDIRPDGSGFDSLDHLLDRERSSFKIGLGI